MSIEEILIIKHGSVYYGISTEIINQILRVPAFTPVVLTSDAILGLSSVSGKIVTVYDINLLLSLPAIDIECEKTRLLSLVGKNESTALVVPEVSDTVLVDAEMLEHIEDSSDGVVAIYKHHDAIVQILDITFLLSRATLSTYELNTVKDGSIRNSESSKEKMNTKRYLFIKMADERYAVDIDSLREIMKLPEEFTEIAGSASEVLGMMALRGELLVVMDLRRFFSFDDSLSEKNRILVTEDKGKTLGLVVDEILDIRDVESDFIDEMPSNFKDNKVSGVIHDEEQLISLIGIDVIRQLSSRSAALIDDKDRTVEILSEKPVEFEVVVFKFGEEEYAINIDDVVEIIDAVEVTPFADSPQFVEGIINIRGQIVMMMSIYEWLSKPKPTSQDQKIIICQINEYRIGFYVDSISDVLGVEKNELKEEDERGDYFSHVLHLEEGSRLVLLFDIHKITQKKEAA
ncbi:MAG: chemotaxis protein CheW [Campylobacterota bacterium]|nr:chemotaxis protein CheW [Campylobacterota bacterium]